MAQLKLLNSLVSIDCVNASFNAKGLYSKNIVEWSIHLMIEASTLYSNKGGDWNIAPPTVAMAAIGVDAKDDFLLGCKTLLKHILSNYLDKRKDLQLIAETAIYTLSSDSEGAGSAGADEQEGIGETTKTDSTATTYENINKCDSETTERTENIGEDKAKKSAPPSQEKLLSPSALVRVYLLRLLMELVLEGIDQLLLAPASTSDGVLGGADKRVRKRDNIAEMLKQTRSGSNNNSNSGGTKNSSSAAVDKARVFLDAFSGTLTPTWFACMLEGCTEDASASITFRLLVLLLQNNSMFEKR